MATSDRQPPAFDKNFLVDLGGWSAFREGKALFEGGAVKHVEWEAPSLHGEVRVGGKSFFPRLNLRSVSFPDARCSCLKGQRGQVCEHLMALCMHYEAHKHDARQEVKPIEPAEPDETAVPSARRAKSSKKSGLKSLFISQAQGEALSLKVFLPPNLEQAAEKDSIVVKIEAHIGDEKGPLEGLDKTKPYKVASHDYLALALLEEWSRGKPSSIVQLSRERLRFLLDNYVDVPAIYFLNQPEQPLEWDDLELPDVYPFLEEDAIEDDDDYDVPVYSSPSPSYVVSTSHSPSPSVYSSSSLTSTSSSFSRSCFSSSSSVPSSDVSSSSSPSLGGQQRMQSYTRLPLNGQGGSVPPRHRCIPHMQCGIHRPRR